MKVHALASLLGLILFCHPTMARADGPLITPFFQNLQAGKKQTVVVYGTSLTFYGPWPGMIKDWLDASYPGLVTLINSGGPGQNSTWGLANVQAKVLVNHPDLVFIEFSYNDAVERFHLTPAQAADNLDKIVAAIHAQNPATAIVLQIMNVPWDAPSTPALTKRPDLETYNNNYRTYAHDHNLPLLDHYPAWKHFEETEPDKFHADIPDGTHPNKDGVLLVMWPAIKDFLEKSRAAALHP